jgi:ABC-type transport system involved in multi-copper enzyme maturation permease subunit
MIWLTWRQFRTQAIVALAVLAAATLYLLITGMRMHHAYTTDLAACSRPQSRCGMVLGQFQQSYSSQQQLFQLFVVAAPALIGIFWGGPLIAGELERGTHRMAWNQSITPARWLAIKLAAVGLAAVATAGLLSLLLTWWASPLDTVSDDRFGAVTFATRGIVPLGYAAFAFALGTAFGLITRRVLPAMAVTLAVFIAVQVLFATQIRAQLLPSTTTTQAVNAALLSHAGGIGTGADPSGPVFLVTPGPPGAWIQSMTDLENSSDEEISATEVTNCLGGVQPNLSSIGGCLAPFHLHISYTFEPADDYWPLQWFETGIYLALAGLLAGACFWRIRHHRD